MSITQSTCLKTGAVVYLEEYRVFIKTDLFIIGNVVHFWVQGEAHISRLGSPETADMVIRETGSQLRAGREVVAHMGMCTPSKELTENLGRVL